VGVKWSENFGQQLIRSKQKKKLKKSAMQSTFQFKTFPLCFTSSWKPCFLLLDMQELHQCHFLDPIISFPISPI